MAVNLQDQAERRRNEREMQAGLAQTNANSRQNRVNAANAGLVGPQQQGYQPATNGNTTSSMFNENAPARDYRGNAAWAGNLINDNYDMGTGNVARNDTLGFMQAMAGMNSGAGANVIQNTPTMMGSQDFAKKFGLTIDSNKLYDVFKRGVDTEYAVKDQEQNALQNQYTAQLGATDKSISDAMRNATSTSVMTGAAKAAQDVNALTQSLGLQQQSVAGLTDLAGQRAMLGDKKAAAYGNAEEMAFTQTQALKQALAGLGTQQYANDTQRYVGQLDYDAQMDTNRVAQENAQLDAASQLEASNNEVYWNAVNEKTARDTDILKQLLMSMTDLDEAQINETIQRYNADSNAATSKYVADRNADAQIRSAAKYGGGGGGSTYTPPPTTVQTAQNEAGAYTVALNAAITSNDPVAYSTAKALYKGTSEEFNTEFKQRQEAYAKAQQNPLYPNNYNAMTGTWTEPPNTAFDPSKPASQNWWSDFWTYAKSTAPKGSRVNP